MIWLAQSFLVLLVDVSVKSLALALIAATTLGILRVRNTNVRHRVWTSVLVGMLVLPLLVPLTPTVPIPAWLTPDFTKGQPVTPNVTGRPDLSAPADIATSKDAKDAADTRALTSFASPIENDQIRIDLRQSGVLEMAAADSGAPKLVADGSVETGSINIEHAGWLRFFFGNWQLAIVLAYLVVAGILLGRVLLGFWRSQQIVAMSRALNIDPQSHRRATVYVSDELRVPLTIGFFRPRILLPACWQEWSLAKLEAVLAHESAHIRRWDYLVTVWAEINRAIYWFHPLAWLLRKRLAELAEQNCDDAVIASTGERTQYARHLLEVASSLRDTHGRLVWTGVAMARKANVETRIDAILDVKRPLARHLGLAGAFVLVAIAVPAVLLAAAIGPADPAVNKEVTALASETAGETAVAPSADEDDSAQKSANETTNTAGPKGLPGEITGQVLGPDGQPVRDAIVYSTAFKRRQGSLSRQPEVDWFPIAETTTDDRGEFRLSLGRADNPAISGAELIVVAYAAGYGPAMVRDVHLGKNAQPTLRLVADTPINGRVLNTEGAPIAGVTLKLRQVIPPKSDEAVTEWIAQARPKEFRGDWRDRDDLSKTAFPHQRNDGRLAHGARPLPADTITGPDGRFTFSGIGSNRLAIIEVFGPTIAKQMVSVVTRDMESILAKPLTWEGTFDAVHHGATFNLVARPTQPIVGRVTDADTAEPLANMTVFVNQSAGNNNVLRPAFLSSKTDDQGRFEIHGAPLGGGHRLAVRPNNREPYFETEKRMPTVNGSAPIECNLSVRKARWISGKVTDAATGEVVEATVHYYPFLENKHAEDYDNYDPNITGAAPNTDVHTAADGSFRIMAIPGEGVLAARASVDSTKYLSDVPADLLERMGGEGMSKMYNPWSAKGFDVIRPVHLQEDVNEFKMVLELTVGMTRSLTIVDADGRPLDGARVLGRTFPGARFEKPLDASTVDIIGLTPGTQRIVYILHEEKKLGKGFLLEPTAKPMTAKLTACAKVNGRFIDHDGEPIAEALVKVRPTVEIDNWSRQLAETKTDDAGRFSVIIPCGLTCRVWVYQPDGPSLNAILEPQVGAIYDLGDIESGTRLEKDDTAKLLVQATGSKARVDTVAKTKDEWKPLTLTMKGEPRDQSALDLGERIDTEFKGQVLAPDGNGQADATVYVVSNRLNHFMRPNQQNVLAKTATDSRGRFEFTVSLPQRDAKLNGRPGHARFEQIIATADGFGAAVSNVIGVREGEAVTLQLPAAQPVEGQILDLEGQPVAGASIRVMMVRPPYKDIEQILADLREQAKEKPAGMLSMFIGRASFLDADIDIYANERIIGSELRSPSVSLPRQVTTDERGRFSIDGVGEDRLIALELSGADIVRTWVSVISRDMSPINKAFFHGCRTNVTYGTRINYSAEPSQPIEGTITDAQTGQPLADFKVEAGQHASGHAIAVSDASGKYRLTGVPKQRIHRLEITPPPDRPYFRRGVRSEETADGLAPIVVDVQLNRTQWIKGRVTDKATGKPVAGRVLYVPHIDNKFAPDYPAMVRLRGTDIQPLDYDHGVDTSEDGTYSVPAIPGKGIIACTASDTKYCVGIGREDLTPDWLQTRYGHDTVKTYAALDPQWVHVIHKVNLREEDATIDLHVDPGATLELQTRDNNGEPLTGVMVKGQQPSSFGRDQPLPTDHVTIQGINTQNPRSVFFYHRDRNLGAYLLADGSHTNLDRVQLQPCGTLKGRLVGSDGKPLSSAVLWLRSANNSLAERHVPIGTTNEEGRFETTNFIPNAAFELMLIRRNVDTLVRELQLKPGETRDLGDLKPKSEVR